MIFDAIVVGAGPGGGSAAFWLRQAGWHVLVLEKHEIPRYKPCGGGVGMRILHSFPFSFQPVIETIAEKATYLLGKQRVDIPLPRSAVAMVMRDRFDAYLLEQAQVDVRTGMAVRSAQVHADGVVVETADGQNYEARYLIGADGAHSTVAKTAGLRRRKRLAAALEVEAVPSERVLQRFARNPMFIFGEIRKGYLWVFPKADHLSVGIAALRPKRGELQNRLKAVMARLGMELEGADVHGHTLPVYVRPEPISTERILLVGDAAGLVDPLTGEGIRFALQSGRLAAEALAAGQPHRYDLMVRRAIGQSHSFGVGLSWVFYNLPWLCFQLGVRNPYATEAFVDLLSDRAGYPEVILRLFGSLPLFALHGVNTLVGRSV